MRDLRDQELEEAVELVPVAARGRGERRRVDVGGLERAHVELQPVAEALDAAEHAHRVAFAEAAVEQLDVVPDPRLDPAGRVDQLEREIRRAGLRAQLALGLDGVDALDDALFGQVRDRHGGTLGPASRCGSRHRLASTATLVEDGLGLLPPPAERAGQVGGGHLGRAGEDEPDQLAARVGLRRQRRPARSAGRAGRPRSRPSRAPARRRRRSSARARAAGAARRGRRPSWRRRATSRRAGAVSGPSVEHRLAQIAARGLRPAPRKSSGRPGRPVSA